MRKIISLGLFALMLSMFSSSAFAGNVEDCEFLKDGNYSKGLYGLCIAYWNTTNAKAQEKILANYDKKAGPDDPVMPGTEDEVVPCTCWSGDHVIEAILSEEISPINYICNAAGTGVEMSVNDRNTWTFFANETHCFFNHDVDPVPFTEHASKESELTCRAGIQEIIYDLWGDNCAD